MVERHPLLPGKRDEAARVQSRAVVRSALRLDACGLEERWHVDLGIPRFTWSEGSTVIFGGPCQLIGTWAASDGFLWGFYNQSIDPVGVQTLRAKLETMGDVTPFLSVRKHAITLDEADAICTWLAVRAGFTGCFAAPQGEATVFLAVTLLGPDAIGQAKQGWCCFCGATHAQARALVAGPRGLMVCDRCGGDVAAVAEVRANDPEPPAPGDDFDATLRVCLMCAKSRGGLILGPHAGVCRDCAQILGDIFR